MREVVEGHVSRGRVRVERGIYRQENGKYAVCFRVGGKLCFRTVGYELELARAQRESFVRAARFGVVAAAPRLRLEMVAGWWLERYERRVSTGARRVRTLEIHSYYLKRHVLPLVGSRLIREITVADVAELLDRLRARGCAEKTVAGALGTLNNVMRFAVRNSWIAESPVEKLERCERPRPERHPQQALGREEIARLLDCCLPAYRALVATALYTGMRLSELLGLIWDDVDLDRACIHVRAQLSHSHIGSPARRVAPKTRAAVRQIPVTHNCRRCCASDGSGRRGARAATGCSRQGKARRSRSATSSEARCTTPPTQLGCESTARGCASTICGTRSRAT
jgi:integrase